MVTERLFTTDYTDGTDKMDFEQKVAKFGAQRADTSNTLAFAIFAALVFNVFSSRSEVGDREC